MDKDKVRRLHKLWQEKDFHAKIIKQAKLDWEQKWKRDLDAQCEIDREIAELDAELKAQRVEEYDGEDKGKVFGVGIRECLKMHYSDDDAFEWAVAHKLALQLDKRTFEKIAMPTPMDFVTITTEPQATIAADLSEYVE